MLPLPWPVTHIQNIIDHGRHAGGRGLVRRYSTRVDAMWSGWSQLGTHVGDRAPSVQWPSCRMRTSGIADLTQRVSC